MGKYYSVQVNPDVNNGAATGTAFTAGDLIFDWTPFEIPKGSAALSSICITVAGHDGANEAQGDFELIFAKSINGAAPITLGNTHAAITAASSLRSKNNVIWFQVCGQSAMTDDLNLVGYHTYTTGTGSSVIDGNAPVLQGSTDNATQGFQKIYMACLAGDSSTPDFGTAVASNEDGSANVAADTTGASVVLKTSGTDPRSCFQSGDQVVGSTGGPTMEVVSVDTATQMTVKNISEQLDNAEIIVPLNPLRFTFGFTY